MYLTEQYEQIITAFELVLKTIDGLCQHMGNELTAYPFIVVNEQDNFINDRDKAIYALKHFEPISSLSPQETWGCPGAVGCTKTTFKLIEAVNKAKDTFKLISQLYKDICKANPTKPVRQVLAAAGYGGIKLKQVYRHIVYINYHPRRIAWSQAKNGANVIVTQAQAKERLLKAGKGEHIDLQLAQLERLNPSEKLVIHRYIKPYWIVNVSSFKDQQGISANEKIRTSLPLFYLHTPDLPNPKVCFSEKIERNSTKPRADKMIEDSVFLPSISAYRYRKFGRTSF